MPGLGGGNLRQPALNDFIRSAESERWLRDIVTRQFGFDIYSRDENNRLNGVRNAALYGGFADRDNWSSQDAILSDDVRRINAIAQLANSAVTPQMRNAEVHPKLSISTGSFMREFELPTRVEEFILMGNDILDRLLRFYHLDRNVSSLPSRHFDRERDYWSSYNLDTTRQDRLIILFEYLGVDVSGERRFGDFGHRLDSGRLGGGLLLDGRVGTGRRIETLGNGRLL